MTFFDFAQSRTMDITYHYSPDLMNLLIDTIPLLFRTKKDVILFFRGAGVNPNLMADIDRRVNEDRSSISKYEMVRTILSRLNEKGEKTLRERREILKRVTEFEDFSTCWPNDQLKAKGLVSGIRRVVDVKDSFTRMNIEREKEKKKYQAQLDAEQRKAEEKRSKLSAVKTDLLSLFKETNAWKRGKALESVLNCLFEANEILVKEAFTLSGNEKEGIVEQIDGVVEIDGNLYLVEMKWLTKPVGIADVSQHLVRVYSRGCARAIFISASSYTEPAITTCREALQRKVVLLCNLKEIVLLLEKEENLIDFFRTKIKAAITDKNPFCQPFDISAN